MLRFSILLLFALQISAVFCGSTADYNDETTDSENTAVSYSEAYEDKKELNLSNEMHNQSAVLQGTMSYELDGGYISYSVDDEERINAIIYLSIAFSIFAFLSFVLGCFVYLCCRKRKIRRGFILRSNAMQEAREVQEQGRPTSTQYFPPNQAGYQQVPPMAQPLQPPVHVNPPHQDKPLLHAPEGGTGYSSFRENNENPTVVEFHNPVSSPPPYESLPQH